MLQAESAEIGTLQQSPSPEPAWQKWMNVALTPIRCQIERLVVLMKRSYAYRRVRYRGLARNRTQFLLMCMVINLRRADRLLVG